ncbi:MAG: proprotein convertase P-domain-containing protein, partial [Anaerolineae bacterium]
MMHESLPLPTCDRPRTTRTRARALLRGGFVVVALAALALAGATLSAALADEAAPDPGIVAAGDAAEISQEDVPTLRVHGYPVVSNPAIRPFANRPATAGSNTAIDPNTGAIPEDPPYTVLDGPFDPLSFEAPEMDFVTWNPAWISERLGEAALQRLWPGLTGIDEVSAGAHIRASSLDASEKVWLRHWYEPQHLDKDLNADGRLTDADPFDGVPDAPVNPTATNVDEWYPAIMTELTYMLVENDPLPQAYPLPSELDASAPRATCGAVGETQMVFPVGVAEEQTDPTGDPVGYGLTSLDVDFDGMIDMVSVSDEETLAGEIGAVLDFDGDGLIDALNPDGLPLSCDELAVLHSDTLMLHLGEQAQFLDHFVRLVGVTDSAAVLEVYYNGDVRPRLIQQRLVGSGATILAGESGPVQIIGPGGDNLGAVPAGPWFAHLVDVDLIDSTALLSVGRAIGAPCAAMEDGPHTPNREPGGPWFLKRFYVDGHEYNVVAIYACGTHEIQYITLRAPLPKVAVTIEQHSVRLQPYGLVGALALPPPFNHEHTVLEDVVALPGFDRLVPDPDFPLPTIRPTVHYMGGPIGPVPPILTAGDQLPYVGRDPLRPIDPPYTDVRAMRWLYVDEDVDKQLLGQLKEKLGAETPGVVVARCENCPVAIPELGTTVGITISPSEFVAACGPNGTVQDVDVLVDVTHGDVGQLAMTLASPDLTLVPIYDHVCAGSTSLQTVFDDEAPAPLTPADCPPIGYSAYQPAPGSLSSFDGEDGFGLWLLTILDTVPGGTGTLQDWSLSIQCQGPGAPAPADTFFYNEQSWTLPWHYTEFVLPDLPQRYGGPLEGFDADKVHVTSAFTDWIARWRRWQMPDEGVPSTVPPAPPDLVANFTPDAAPPQFGFPLGAPRRAAFWFDPDVGGKLFADTDGVKIYGGLPETSPLGCDPRRPSQAVSAGDPDRRRERDTGYPVEVLPYTDPWAPFNPQHLHAPRSDSLTFNPAYMDEFRNFDEDLRLLYAQISNDAQNAREKVYHRLWYEPQYLAKVRFLDDCERDLRFPAVTQEYTYLYMDTTDNPSAAPAGTSKFAFPIGTTAEQLPAPVPGSTVLPAGGEFGYGLTTFDADFDGFPDAVTVHSEQTLADYMNVQWQTNRPSIPGFPLPPVPGAQLDFDGDGQLDALDGDGVPLSGDEMVVFAVESITLDLDERTPIGSNAMLLDYLVSLENVTPGSNAQFRIWFTGGNGDDARPEPVGGVRVLEIGEAALVDRFQGSVTTVSPAAAPDNMNSGTDGAWFVFVEDVATTAERVVVTVGRAIGATHSAIDDGSGAHDLVPGDPWYLKRFYVDGHEYNAVALMTLARDGTGGE